jgi:transposase-like protein
MMTKISYRGYRFPPVIIQQAIWLYARFTLSFRDVEDLLRPLFLNVTMPFNLNCASRNAGLQ